MAYIERATARGMTHPQGETLLRRHVEAGYEPPPGLWAAFDVAAGYANWYAPHHHNVWGMLPNLHVMPW